MFLFVEELYEKISTTCVCSCVANTKLEPLETDGKLLAMATASSRFHYQLLIILLINRSVVLSLKCPRI